MASGSNRNDLARSLTEAIGRAINATLSVTEHQLPPSQSHTASSTVESSNTYSLPQRCNTQLRSVGVEQQPGQRRVQSLLPSILGGVAQGGSKRKRSTACQPKASKIYTKDVVCLLPVEDLSEIPIPRGAKRTHLAEMGLVGKISINSTWKGGEVRREISSVFESAFNLPDGELLSFDFLSIIPGAKKLGIPKTSMSFCWNAPEVLSLCSQGCLYVLARIKPFEKENESQEDEEVIEMEPNFPPAFTSGTPAIAPSSLTGTTSTGERTSYSSYLHLLASNPIDVSDDDSDEELQTALHNSLVTPPKNSCSGEENTIKNVLADHIKEVMAGQPSDLEVSKNLINVRRNHVFIDGLRKIGKPNFQASLPFSVKFADEIGSSEGAVDLGGPTREFLRLAIHDMFLSNEVLVLNQDAKRKNLYFLCGKLLAISLCNGGSVGHCLSQSMYDFLVYGESGSHPFIQDVQEPVIKEILQKIYDCKTASLFTEITHSDAAFDCFAQAGYNGIPKFGKKDQLLQDLCHFFVLDKMRSALEQFKEGLATLEILSLMRKYPHLLSSCFCHNPEPLTSRTVIELFKPCYSEDGTRQREKEELIIVHWRDYVQECEDSQVRSATTLENILEFTTGANEVPPLGFHPNPTLQFWNDIRPRSNTCGNVLFLSLHPSSDINEEVEYETFKLYMDDAILNSPTFGVA